MLCQKCKKNNATFFYTQSVNGNTYSVALCDECKKEQFPNTEHNSHYNLLSENIFNTSLFPSSLFYTPFLDQTKEEKRCSSCKASFFELCNGRAFCPECYRVFSEELGGSLKNMHGSAVHKGRRPSRECAETTAAFEKSEKEPKKESEIYLLKEKLQKAINEERYEDAASLRDKIKELESKRKGE